MSAAGGALDGRAVIVTGTSRGIGAGIVASLMAAGASVLGVSRSRASGASADEGSPGVTESQSASRRTPACGELVHLQCDLLSLDAPTAVLDAALDAFGRVDALVNNAGLLIDGACWAQPEEQLDAMLALNLTAPFRLSQALAAHWLRLDAGGGAAEGRNPAAAAAVVAGRGAPEVRDVAPTRGAVVNVCSIESQVGWADPPQAAYAASKGGLLGLTRAMALELAPHGIRVVAVGPGAIATAMTPSDPAVTDAIPLGRRLGTPQEVGDVVAFLLSDAASYITGEIVYADGGYLLA